MSLERIEGYDAWKTRLPEECPDPNCIDGVVHGRDGDGREVLGPCHDPAHMGPQELRAYRLERKAEEMGF